MVLSNLTISGKGIKTYYTVVIVGNYTIVPFNEKQKRYTNITNHNY